MAHVNSEHVRELAVLREAAGTTPEQKLALKYAMIALRECGKDFSIDRMITETVAEETPLSGLTSVYKYFDKRGILIYVGITSGGILRNRQHNDSKEWWPFVVKQKVEHFRSRDHAHEREVALIDRFRPPFNKQHNKDHAAARRFYLDMVKGHVSAPKLLRDRKSLHSQIA